MVTRKTFLLLFFVIALPAVAAKGRPGRAEQKVKAYKSSLEQLVEQSHRIRPRCEAFVAQAKKNGWLTLGKDAFDSKREALRVLSFVRTYPATPRATHQAFSRLIRGVPKGVDGGWLMNIVNQLETCQKMAMYQVFLKLLTSASVYQFSKKQKVEVVRITKFFVKKELSKPNTLISFLVQLAIVEKLLEENLIRIPLEVRSGVGQVAKDADRVLGKMRKEIQVSRKRKISGKSNEIIQELRQANRLRVRLGRSISML